MSDIIASPYTKIFWDEWQINKNRSDYNIIVCNTILGDLNIARLTQGLKCLVEDHILLGSHLFEHDKLLYWTKNEQVNYLEVFNNSATSSTIKNYAMRHFDLQNEPLYRFALFKIKPKHYILMLVLHHVLIDGTNLDQFIDFVSKYYEFPVNHTDLLQQTDAINKVNNVLLNKVIALRRAGAVKFWDKLLAISSSSLNEFTNNNSATNLLGMNECYFDINKNVMENLQNKFKYNAFNLFLSIYAVLLAKYTNSNLVCIAYPKKIKMCSDFIYGAQINTLLLPLYVDSNDTLTHILDKIKKYIISISQDSATSSYSEFPVNEILDKNKLKKFYFAKTNLKNTLMQFNGCKSLREKNYAINIEWGEISLEYEELLSKYEFRLRIKENLFTHTANFMKEFVDNFKNLLQLFTKSSAKPMSEICVLTQEQYNRVLNFSRPTDKYSLPSCLINELFAIQVKKYPNHTALVFEKQNMTYQVKYGFYLLKNFFDNFLCSSAVVARQLYQILNYPPKTTVPKHLRIIHIIAGF